MLVAAADDFCCDFIYFAFSLLRSLFLHLLFSPREHFSYARTPTLNAFSSATPSPSSPLILLTTDVVLTFQISMLLFNSTHPGVLNHSPIAVSERLVLVVQVQLVFYLQGGNRHFVVRISPTIMSLFQQISLLSEIFFLKEHLYIIISPNNQQQHQDERRSEDPNITLFLNKVRVVLKTDRAIHDLVRGNFWVELYATNTEFKSNICLKAAFLTSH